MADAQLPLIVTLAEELEALPTDARTKAAASGLTALTATYRAIEDILLTPVLRSSAAPLDLASEPVSSKISLPPTSLLLMRLEHESTSALARVRALDIPLDAANESADPESGFLRESLSALRQDLRTLRDTLSPRSTFFRHALRVAGAALVASLVGHRLSSHPQWVTITTLAVLQPYPGATVSRAAERVVGTVLGGIVAIAITMTVRSPLALAALMFPLSVAAVATRPRSYRLFTFFLTPVFVLLSERYQGDWWTAAARGADAMLGGAIALVAAVLIFPSREIRRVPDTTATMLRAVAAYAAAVLAHLDRRHEAESVLRVGEARRTAGIALGEAETSLERLLSEPLRKVHEGEDALQLITYARRTTSAVTALDTYAARDLARGTLAADVAEDVGAYVAKTLDAAQTFVCDGVRAAPLPVPELPIDLDWHLRIGLERVLRYAALVGTVVRG